MDVLYRGFDGLDVSFQGQIDFRLCEVLEKAKENAQRLHNDQLIDLNGIRMLVAESGARGGYAFRTSTGPFGATWFFKKPNARDPWGVRVSCNSFNLALNGLGKARTDLQRTLETLGIAVELGTESISRIDYAVDFLAPNFELVPDNFVMHSNSSRADQLEYSDMTAHGRSGRITSVTVGKMPGRQVIVYDKRAEVIAKHKIGWLEIWNASRERLGLPLLNFADPTESRIWRVELRAGKHHLKERWKIRSWHALDSLFGDLVSGTLDAIRYTQSTGDANRSRWPDSELWKLVRAQTDSDLFELRLFVEPERVKLVQREAHDQLLAAQMAGLLTSRAALNDIEPQTLANFAQQVGQEMAMNIVKAPAHFERKLTRAAERYVHW